MILRARLGDVDLLALRAIAVANAAMASRPTSKIRRRIACMRPPDELGWVGTLPIVSKAGCGSTTKIVAIRVAAHGCEVSGVILGRT